MLNNIRELIKREITLNYKSFTFCFPFVLIILVAFTILPSSLVNEKSIVIILGLSINIIFSMVLFPQIYLKELKNEETKFLFTFLVDKDKIVISKIAYILISVLFLNFILLIPEYILLNNFDVSLNVFFIDVIAGVSTGLLYLTFFLTSEYEFFKKVLLYVWEIFVGIIFAAIYIIKVNLWDVINVFNINPLYSIGFLVVLIFASIKLLKIMFNNKS